MKVLVIDNYDSFTYNLVYILRQELIDVEVFRNDKIALQDCLDYNGIVLSPGPGIPKNAGRLINIIKTCAGKIPILGICLGHQAIAEYLGSELTRLNTVCHGKQSVVSLKRNKGKLLKNISQPFLAGRYHSWSVVPKYNKNFEVIAVSDDENIMAIQNLEQNLYGIQFHPESILTPKGGVIIRNFLSICKKEKL